MHIPTFFSSPCFSPPFPGNPINQSVYTPFESWEQPELELTHKLRELEKTREIVVYSALRQ